MPGFNICIISNKKHSFNIETNSFEWGSIMSQRLAIDVGGTFTDVVLVNDKTGFISYTKTPSSPGDPSEGVLNGVHKILSQVKSTGRK